MLYIIRDFFPKSKSISVKYVYGMKKPRICGAALLKNSASFLLLKQRLVYAAERTYEVLRQILERHTGGEIIVRIANRLVINPAANCTNPCLHGKPSFNIIHRCIGQSDLSANYYSITIIILQHFYLFG